MTGFIRQTLAQLFNKIPIKVLSPVLLPDIPLTGIALDSRAVEQGSLFVALEGENVDGHHYILDAVQRGAASVVGMIPPLGNLPIPYVQVEDTRFALAHLSAAFYDFPARHMTMIGVTGTDGKTTTTNLIYQILIAAGYRAGIISTVNAVIGDEVLDTGLHVTTPEAPEVQHYLSRMHAAGLTHIVLETTSHGLAQHRVTACEFDIGVVTNITHEHLDFHGSYEAYREAKATLFTSLRDTHPKNCGNIQLSVLNKDDLSFDFLRNKITGRIISYSLHDGADLYADDERYDSGGLHFSAVGPNFHLPLESSLIGNHNVSNILAALGTTIFGLEIPLECVQQGIKAMRSIPGRMEWINNGQNFIAIVDFAHTPNALRRTLETARQLTSGRVLVVFGSAGLRDRQKRRMMPEVAVELADVTIITAEDPRTEPLGDILNEMAQAAHQKGGVEGKTFFCVPDRGEAIRQAVNLAKPGDVVISCGKGHEQSMCFGEIEYPWDDRVAMRAVLAEYLNLPGAKVPYLPTQDNNAL
jgi:UDP-N-acetylmuramoyl-L-alanyl-D-glutamate--2,6-diaminopimelate ligase